MSRAYERRNEYDRNKSNDFEDRNIVRIGRTQIRGYYYNKPCARAHNKAFYFKARRSEKDYVGTYSYVVVTLFILGRWIEVSIAVLIIRSSVLEEYKRVMKK